MNVKGGLFNWAALKNPVYAVYCISGVIAFLGMYTCEFIVFVFPFCTTSLSREVVQWLGTRANILWTVLMYIPISAIQVGVPNDFAFYLAAIANATSILGRIVAGFLADQFGEYRSVAE